MTDPDRPPKPSRPALVPPALSRRATDGPLRPLDEQEDSTPVEVPIPRYTPPPVVRRPSAFWQAAAGWGTDACAMLALVALCGGGMIDGKTAVGAILIVVVGRLRPPPTSGGGVSPGGVFSILAPLVGLSERR